MPSVNEQLIGDSVSCLDLVISLWSFFSAVNPSPVYYTTACRPSRRSCLITSKTGFIFDERSTRNDKNSNSGLFSSVTLKRF